MMKKLIIAEKPSVARDIAEALGVGSRLENDTLVISNCIGHLVTLSYPTDSNTTLPILPDKFSLDLIPGTKDQFKKLSSLIQRNDISTIINACDAGREGELIFRLVYDKVGVKKPIERMWLQSMTPDAIRQAYRDRKEGVIYESLYDAAKSRSEADWLVGINGSRAVKSAVGRVMTPTLAMVVNRYEENKNFKVSTFYEIVADFNVSAGQYTAKLIKDKEPLRFNTLDEATALANELSGHNPWHIEEFKEIKKKLAPTLFDLTSLQQEANRKFGYAAAKTLTITQALYENHKAVTYPRTDANVLPSDYVITAEQALEALEQRYPIARKAIENNWVQINHANKRIFNDAKISDHFAIIPTGHLPSDLDEDEQNIYDLIVKRFIAIFYPPAEYNHTKRLTSFDTYRFSTTGNVLITSGWLEVFDYESDNEDVNDEDKEEKLVPIQDNESAKLINVQPKEGKTTPPPLYNEATLLKAMETAGKTIEDEAYADAIKSKGIGTPATRAGVIEKLKKKGKTEPYMVMSKKSLIPTERGIKLIHFLRDKTPHLISPELTGEWEFKLAQIERKEVNRSDFMKEIHTAVIEIVNAFSVAGKISTQRESIGVCPSCGENDLHDRKYSFMCDCGFKINKEIAGYKLSKKDLSDIVSQGKTEKINAFKSKASKPFTASLVVDKQKNNLVFEF
ncbi:DNA topoisomerase [Oligella urethralis]|nr:DNA topoisomerase [Oligella urethralis]